MKNHDSHLTRIGEATPLQEDMSPITIDTKGMVDNKKFTVLGRIRILFDDYVYNQWTILMDDFSIAFLGESEGSYAIYTEDPNFSFGKNIGVTNPDKIILGNGKYRYLLTSHLKTKKVECEGEFMVYPQVPSFLFIELSCGNKMMANVFLIQDIPTTFIGKYYGFKELQFTNLRKFNGWE